MPKPSPKTSERLTRTELIDKRVTDAFGAYQEWALPQF
jgi:hypothetical protein